MSTTLQLRRGLKSSLPAEAAVGEALVAMDTMELFIGQGPGIAPKMVGSFIGEREDDLTDQVDGNAHTFTVLAGHYLQSTLHVYVRGVRQRKDRQGQTIDFTELVPGSGTFTVHELLPAGTPLVAEYLPIG